MVLESKGDTAIKMMCKLLQAFWKIGLITVDQMNRGFQRVYDELPEINLDVPHAHSIMESFTDLCYQESVITKQLRDSCPSSYIYDPTAPVDVHGRKRDPAETSLYQSHHLPGDSRNQFNTKQNQGFHNLGFSNKCNERGGGGSLKLEIDNNHINRLHTMPTNPERERGTGQAAKPRVGEGGGGLYILHPEGQVPRRDPSKGPSLVQVYPNTPSLDLSLNLTHSGDTDSHPDNIRIVRNVSDPSIGDRCGVGCNTSSADELDEGVGGTPEYLGDTGDEQSVLSATSLSSAGTKDDRGTPDATTVESGIGISVMKSEDEGKEGEDDDVQSVTDSMVAEALGALEAATAGEDYGD